MHFFCVAGEHMKSRCIRTLLAAPVCLALMLSGCAGKSVKDLWPLGGESTQERSRTPSNSTEFQCNGGKHLYVRYLDSGGSAWLIFPEREVRLDKVASTPGTTGVRYSNGSAVLNVNGNEATYTDGSEISYAGCKTAGP